MYDLMKSEILARVVVLALAFYSRGMILLRMMLVLAEEDDCSVFLSRY